MRRLATLLLPALLVAQGTLPYRDPALPVEARVKDLLSRMTLEEKVRQMDLYRGEGFLEGRAFSPAKARATAGTLGIGAIHDLYPKDAATANAVQEAVIRSSRLGIPALVMAEMLHGYVDPGSTAFPMNIGLASSWDRDLLRRVGRAVATEARARGVHFGLGPNLDLGREPRWGRIAETLGEDTQLAGELGLAYVRGLQGPSLAAPDAIISEPKHFAVHGIPQTGGNASPSVIGERMARQEHLATFEKAIRKGGALGVMAAYSELDGVPCAANRWLMTDVLRKEWGFQGIVLSDLGAIKYLQTTHHVTASPRESIRKAIAAGLDMQFYDFPSDVFQGTVLDLVKTGELDPAHVDRAAGAVLGLKFRLGLFESPWTRVTDADLEAKRQAHRALALEAARKSLVLLKNDGGLLPITGRKRIALIGPNADRSVLGGYAVREKKAVTLLEGMRQEAPAGVEILHHPGVGLLDMGVAVPATCLATPDRSAPGLKGEYFANPDLKGAPVLTRTDATVAFDWPWSPGPGVPDDQFSVRWTGWLTPGTDFGTRLGLSGDDGIRLWIDDVLVLDRWSAVTNIAAADLALVPGRTYKIRLEMWEGGWGARAHLRHFPVQKDLEQAVDLARKADLAVVALGEDEDLVEENRDVSSLDLQGRQMELLRAIQATGTPTVCVLLNGRPLAIREAAARTPALLEAWFPGEALGTAVARTLFGKDNPAGRLPVTFPRSVGQLPVYYTTRPSAIHRYTDSEEGPLFPFGHGLSYTTFAYRDLTVTPETTDGRVTVRVTVTNTGPRDGEEVVQLYLRDLVSSVTTPLRQLKGFERVFLPKGASRTLTFTLQPEDLALWDADLRHIAEAGRFDLYVGGNAQADLKATFTLTRDLLLQQATRR